MRITKDKIRGFKESLYWRQAVAPSLSHTSHGGSGKQKSVHSLLSQCLACQQPPLPGQAATTYLPAPLPATPTVPTRPPPHSRRALAMQTSVLKQKGKALVTSSPLGSVDWLQTGIGEVWCILCSSAVTGPLCSPGPQFLLVTNDGSRRLWTRVGLPWDPRSAQGKPTSLRGWEALGRGGEEPPVRPRPPGPGAAAGAAATAHAATRGRPRRGPNPARVHGLSDRLEGGGLREERPQVVGRGGDSAGGAPGTEGRRATADGRDGCGGTTEDRNALAAGRGVTAGGPGRGSPAPLTPSRARCSRVVAPSRTGAEPGD